VFDDFYLIDLVSIDLVLCWPRFIIYCYFFSQLQFWFS